MRTYEPLGQLMLGSENFAPVLMSEEITNFFLCGILR